MRTDMRPASGSLLVCDRARTAALLGFPALVDAIAVAAAQLAHGAIHSPERHALPLGQGGVLLSMPATAPDIAIHKLANIQKANAARGLPTLQGVVTVCDAATGRPLCLLDGPELTARRTAAVTMLALRTLLPAAPAALLLIGTGVLAVSHLQALHAVHPGCRVWVRARTAQGARAFCDTWRALHPELLPCPEQLPPALQAVVAVTTSTEPVYDAPACAGRLVVGVGAFRPEMAEIGATTLAGSLVVADDPAGARHEAGDLLRAGVDFAGVRSLAQVLRERPPAGQPVVFKSVGSAAWDLAAARVALAALGSALPA